MIEGEAKGGLVLFYNKDAHSGIVADRKNILPNINKWQFTTENNVINGRVFLRLKNVDHAVDMFYGTDGVKWTKIANSLEVSGMHHNVRCFYELARWPYGIRQWSGFVHEFHLYSDKIIFQQLASIQGLSFLNNNIANH